ncbi:hypothetical protein [Defluviimonas salinarum]|uniref:SnoaL-like domain-containing protein n=1 Tax=Defluviimonas salinarum TaxID=2992147 RepID=A0ABT3J9E1_9RHOB|nr:hypothetical protein [Defluviimonas salinarum]MCW3784303.1 hypothetical protein [Defluviimonas salinarum]
MSYKRYIIGFVTIAPPLPEAAIRTVTEFIRREDVTSNVKGLELGRDRLWFDNDAAWRPGIDGNFSPEAFAAGLAGVMEMIGTAAGSTTDGEFIITWEGLSGRDHRRSVSIEAGQVRLSGRRVTPAEYEDPEEDDLAP